MNPPVSKLLSPATRRRFFKRFQRLREVVAPQAFKREHVESGRGCEVCGWCLESGDWRSLHCHHVIPVSCGGTDRVSNLVVLCPNHHAAAHRTGKRRGAVWQGPISREELFASLVRLERPAIEVA